MPNEEPRILTRMTETLPVILGSDVVLAYAVELAGLAARFVALDEEEAEAKAGLKSRRAELEASRSRLSQIITQRSELRRIPVTVRADDARGMARYVRDDTGETFRERDLSPEERQLTIPGEPVPRSVDQRIESMDRAAGRARRASAVAFCGRGGCGHGQDLHQEGGAGRCSTAGCVCEAFIAGGRAEVVRRDE